MEAVILKLLKNWDAYNQKDYYTIPDKPDLLCYGTGYGGWAVQTNQKALAAIAMLGVHKKDSVLIDKALKMLRFSLQSHIEGDIVCLDGEKWGHTWISALGIERMMHAVYALLPYMPDDDKVLLKKVLISECDWLCDQYDIAADLLSKNGKNRPESNAWNGAVLYRTAMMYPNAPRRDLYIKKAEMYFLNAISLPEDTNIPGCVGSNFFTSYALNHHGYMNLGYMVITLSQIAMLHFFCKERKIQPPKHMYQHVKELWQLVKSCTAPDGRLIRIGGDTRVRYCYCQDYAIPTWLFILDYLQDTDCIEYLSGWIKTVEKECDFNHDGSFLSARCGKMRTYSPIYYTRLESDRAAALSMYLAWKPELCKPSLACTLPTWHDDFHGCAFVQNEKNIRSWSWRGAGGPVGLCLPKSDTSLAEWDKNLVGEIKGIGVIHQYDLTENQEMMFPGGFSTIGTLELSGTLFEAEQQTIDHLGTEKIAVSCLPDGATTLVMQYATLPENTRSTILSVKGLNLKVPNDLFNDCKRKYYFSDTMLVKNGLEGERKLTTGKWLNVDDHLGVCLLYGADALTVHSPGKRQIAISKYAHRNTGFDTGNLYCDEILAEFSTDLQDLWGDKHLIDNGFALIANADHKQTAAISEKKKALEIIYNNPSAVIRSIEIQGQDGNQYLFIANFGTQSEFVTIKSKAAALIDIHTSQSEENQIQLSKNSVRLFKVL